MISDVQLVRFAEETKQDEILPDLQKVILSGWRETRSQVSAKLQAFWKNRDELTVGHGLVLKGQKIIVPKPLREEMLERLHEGHLGINKTLMKARDLLFWPGMAAEITEKVKKCPLCLENPPCQQSEPLKSHEIPPLPWAKVGTDLLHKNDRNYLVTIDHYSKWPELTLLNSMTSTAVITALKSQFARYGVPSVLMSDNGPCYSSEQFKQFSQDWCLILIMSHRALDTHSVMANQKVCQNPDKNTGEILMTRTKPSYHTGILHWMELTCRRLRCSWADV